MSLTTTVYILAFVDLTQTFGWVNKHLLHAQNPQQSRSRENEICNKPAQGLDAWALIKCYPEGANFEDCLRTKHALRGRKVFAELDFDTTYSFNREGLTCSKLHAGYIRKLVEHFEPQGIDIIWHNGYTGKLWDNLEGLDTLERL